AASLTNPAYCVSGNCDIETSVSPSSPGNSARITLWYCSDDSRRSGCSLTSAHRGLGTSPMLPLQAAPAAIAIRRTELAGGVRDMEPPDREPLRMEPR